MTTQWTPPPLFARGDGPCEDCGQSTISWFVNNLMWNTVCRSSGYDRDPMLCPSCFVQRAARRGIEATWELVPTPATLRGWPDTAHFAVRSCHLCDEVERKGGTPNDTCPVCDGTRREVER